LKVVIGERGSVDPEVIRVGGAGYLAVGIAGVSPTRD